MDDFTITTVYFDGQFWCAFIQKMAGGTLYAGRYVFGVEPSNPRILEWTLHEFLNVRLYKTEPGQKIRLKDAAKTVRGAKPFLPKSFGRFSEARKAHAQESRRAARNARKSQAREAYRKKQEQKKRR